MDEIWTFQGIVAQGTVDGLSETDFCQELSENLAVLMDSLKNKYPTLHFNERSA